MPSGRGWRSVKGGDHGRHLLHGIGIERVRKADRDLPHPRLGQFPAPPYVILDRAGVVSPRHLGWIAMTGPDPLDQLGDVAVPGPDEHRGQVGQVDLTRVAPSRRQWDRSTSALCRTAEMSPITLAASAYLAARRRVRRSPPPPTNTGTCSCSGRG